MYNYIVILIFQHSDEFIKAIYNITLFSDSKNLTFPILIFALVELSLMGFFAQSYEYSMPLCSVLYIIVIVFGTNETYEY